MNSPAGGNLASINSVLKNSTVASIYTKTTLIGAITGEKLNVTGPLYLINFVLGELKERYLVQNSVKIN